MSSHVVHSDPTNAHLRVDEWDFGPMSLLRIQASSMRMTRTPRQAKDDHPPVIALSIQMRAGGVHMQDGVSLPVRSGASFMVELSRPYVSDIPADLQGWSIKIPLQALGLPPELVTSARTGLVDSPVFDVFQRHFRAVAANAQDLHDDVGHRLTGTATVALARALLASAARDERYSRGALSDVLSARVRNYVLEHLRDPDLRPETIAAAHHISLRALYQVCAQAGIRLEQMIIQERLEGARTELGQNQDAYRSIAAIGRGWGFTSPSHFTHRFRAEYGMSPRDWRHLAAERA